MFLKSEDIKRLELEYDSGIIPPPFSHAFKLKISFEKSFINTQFAIQYLDRDEISEDEIIGEGFTLEDDYTFLGEVPKVWEAPFKKLYSESTWSNKKEPDAAGGIKILAKDIHGKMVRTIPNNQEDWQFLAQELIQAIYEINKKEAPLTIRYRNITNTSTMDYHITVKFSVRKVILEINEEIHEVDWDKSKELLSYIFLPDYDYSIASEKTPTKNGQYIDCGDGLWHKFGKGVINLDDNFDAVSKIKQGIENLNQQ